MYCRNVIFKLKGKSAVEFTRILEEEIIPSLRGQRGFEDEISFIAPERNEAVAISLWEEIDDAEIYHQKTFPGVLKILSKVIDDAPNVETFAIGNFTSHEVAASAVKQTVLPVRRGE